MGNDEIDRDTINLLCQLCYKSNFLFNYAMNLANYAINPKAYMFNIIHVRYTTV